MKRHRDPNAIQPTLKFSRLCSIPNKHAVG
jgi:hypothetical protein